MCMGRKACLCTFFQLNDLVFLLSNILFSLREEVLLSCTFLTCPIFVGFFFILSKTYLPVGGSSSLTSPLSVPGELQRGEWWDRGPLLVMDHSQKNLHRSCVVRKKKPSCHQKIFRWMIWSISTWRDFEVIWFETHHFKNQKTEA